MRLFDFGRNCAKNYASIICLRPMAGTMYMYFEYRLTSQAIVTSTHICIVP